jgi:hypothetical protein
MSDTNSIVTPTQNNGLANLKSWQPGQSGNPGGRPKRKRITEAYKRLGKMSPAEFGAYEPRTMFESMARDMILANGKNLVPAKREITNRLEGSVETSEGTSISGSNVVIVSSWRKPELSE